MKKGKRRARRLALYLRSIGIQPWAAGLQFQYDELEAEQRKLARRAGRQLIQEAGSIAKAVALSQPQLFYNPCGQRPAGGPSHPIQRRAVQFYLQALVSAHTSLPLLPDGKRLPQTFLAHPGVGR